MGLRNTIVTEIDFENSYTDKINRRKHDCWLDGMSLLNPFSGKCSPEIFFNVFREFKIRTLNTNG